jgi:hypothetical protein
MSQASSAAIEAVISPPTLRRPKQKQKLPRFLPPDADGAFEIDEFGEWSGLGKTMTYAEAKVGRLIMTKVGRKSIITFANARAWLNALPVRKVA